MSGAFATNIRETSRKLSTRRIDRGRFRCARGPHAECAQDALHGRDAVNAQQTAASGMPAPKERPRKRGRKSARNLTHTMVPQTVGGTVLVVRFGGR